MVSPQSLAVHLLRFRSFPMVEPFFSVSVVSQQLPFILALSFPAVFEQLFQAKGYLSKVKRVIQNPDSMLVDFVCVIRLSLKFASLFICSCRARKLFPVTSRKQLLSIFEMPMTAVPTYAKFQLLFQK